MKKDGQKKQKPTQISKVVFKNAIMVLWILVLSFACVATISILAFASGAWFKNAPSPFGGYLLAIFSLFCLILFVIYYKNAKLSRTIKELEDATEKVAKGDFKIQVELTGNEDIDSYIQNFNKMVHALGGIETLKENFISDVSHEIKTPIAVIQSYSKALRHTDLDEKTRARYEKVLDDNIKKLSNLTTNVLNLSRLENQDISLSKSEFSLDEQLRQCILSFEPQWTKKHIDLQLDLPNTTYYGYADLINQIWQNLISNAIKFTGEKGKIAVSIEKQNDYIVVSVSDNGIGIPEEAIDKIFEKFYQCDTSHSKEGNGLGLALVKRIVHICGGEITASSKPDCGATFVVKLPLSE